MDKGDLRKKLRILQDLKRERYIRADEAWGYMKGVVYLEENPQKVADAVNEAVSKGGPVYFEASPERIMGLGDYIGRTDSYWDNELFELYGHEVYGEESEKYQGEYVYKRGMDISQSPIARCDDLLVGDNRGGEKKQPDPDKLIDYLIPIYKDFRKIYRGMEDTEISNSLFGIFSLTNLFEEFSHHKNQKEFFAERSFSTNWNYVFSKENLRGIEKNLRRTIFSEHTDLFSRIDRMINDQVDHRLENRREILCDFIDSWVNYNDEMDYDSIREIVIRLHNMSKDRLKKFDNFGPGYDLYVEKEKRLIRCREFLLTALAPERNFVNRYLRN